MKIVIESFAEAITTDTASKTGEDGFEILQIHKTSNTEELEEIYKLILEHPVIEDAFLCPPNNSSKKHRKYREVVTLHVSTIVETMPADMRMRMKDSFEGYLHRIQAELAFHMDSKQTSNSNSELLKSALNGFVDKLEDADLIEICEVMFGIPVDKLICDDLLTTDGNILLSVVKELCNRKDTKAFSRHKISHKGMVKLFLISSYTSSTMDLLLHILTECPAYSVCIGENTFNVFLDKVCTSPVYCDVVSILMISSNVCCCWAGNWITGAKMWKKKKLRMQNNVLQFVLNYLLSSIGMSLNSSLVRIYLSFRPIQI